MTFVVLELKWESHAPFEAPPVIKEWEATNPLKKHLRVNALEMMTA
jgi:hypothetical protein